MDQRDLADWPAPRRSGIVIYLYGGRFLGDHSSATQHPPDTPGEIEGAEYSARTTAPGVGDVADVETRLLNLFNAAQKLNTPLAMVRADKITPDLLNQLHQMTLAATAFPDINILPELGTDVADMHADVATAISSVSNATNHATILQAQPSIAVWLPPSAGESNTLGNADGGGDGEAGKKQFAVHTGEVVEMLSTAVELLHKVNSAGAAVIDQQIATITKQHEDPNSDSKWLTARDGTFNVHESVKHYTELRGTAMFNFRRTHPPTNASALVYCEKCAGYGIAPCPSGDEWGVNRVRQLMMINRKYKLKVLCGARFHT
jgi:hypothetical protein